MSKKGGTTLKNQNKNELNYDFIKSLVERPDLDPDMAFVNKLRKEITRVNIDSSSLSPSLPKRLKIIGVVLMAISTLYVLFLSFETENPSLGTEKVEDTPISTIHHYDIDDLLSNHPSYNQMYKEILKETQSTKAAEMFVLYLEALKQGDIEEFKKYSIMDQDFKIKPLIDDYKQVDFETLAIENMIWSQAEPSIEVQISYQRKNTTAEELRSLHVHLNDGVRMDVYEQFDWRK